jgi:hypothetical protein
VIGRLAVRSLTAHPVRSAVLAGGFGVGVAVMAILLGVAEIVLEQSRAPELAGGGDVVIAAGPQVPARLLLAGTLQGQALRPRIRAASPSDEADLYLVRDGRTTRISARGGIPSLEHALGDPETSSIAEWRDSAADISWTQNTPDQLLAFVDRFHPIPDAPEWSASWAEWLYFNGRSGDARFYLTFLVGPATRDGRRAAGVRLQLDRGRGVETFTAAQTLSDEEALRAPNLTIGANAVQLAGLQYRIHLDLRGASGVRALGDLTLDASPGRLIPPIEISGAREWRTGYVVPVMSGALGGTVDVGGDRVSFAGGSGYHDHNWGFWEGVSWQWGQVQHGNMSIIYGRVFPPPEAADPERLPAFVGVLGPEGPLGYASSLRNQAGDPATVTIAETDNARGEPASITITARSGLLDLKLDFTVESRITTRAAGSAGPLGSGLDFLQMRGVYRVEGRAGSRPLNFSAPGSAETFRGRRSTP